VGSLQKLQTVSKRISAFESVQPRDRFALDDFQPQAVDKGLHRREVIHFETQVSLRLPPFDAILGSHVYLDGPELNPKAASSEEGFRLAYLFQAKASAIELARF